MNMVLTTIVLIYLLLCPSHGKDYCDLSVGQSKEHNISSLKLSLTSLVSGPVAAPWDDLYEQFRAVHNPACCQRPSLVIRPVDSQVGVCG